ncbi:carbohydrate ABC transporter permease [Pseudonocardia nigra]|uniref:carbohydrate ABC transporter permease n=1 Tax=Pseudonocardia nigra TaxID=1921578 RepID=UPI001C60597C|nr:sugar ABC transporter permease [Pseudonocardia nigra]
MSPTEVRPKPQAEPQPRSSARPAKEWTGRSRRRREALAAYGFLSPWIAGMLLLTIGPMIYSLYLSFTSYNLMTPPEWVGFENYTRMLTADPRYLNSVGVTVRYVLISVPAVLVVSLLVAMVLNRGMRFLSGYRAAFYLPSLIAASVAIAVLWRQVFGRDGILNEVLALVGIEGGSWIGNPDTALYTLVVLNVWAFGSTMIIFLAGLRQVPKELYEAAAVDGAGAVRRFFHVTLPMLTPLIFFNLLLTTVNAFQAFTPAYVISRGEGGPLDSTLFYTLYLYQRGFANLEMGYASAMAWTLVVVLALFTAGLFASARFWVHYGDER